MNRDLAVRMWLEYALEGDESAIRSTGRSVNGCVAMALDLIEGRTEGWEAHWAHMAVVAIDDVRGRKR